MAPPPWLPRRRIDFGKAWYARWAKESPSTTSSGRRVLAISSSSFRSMCNRLEVEGWASERLDRLGRGLLAAHYNDGLAMLEGVEPAQSAEVGGCDVRR